MELSRLDEEDLMSRSFQSEQKNVDDSQKIKKLQLQMKKLIS